MTELGSIEDIYRLTPAQEGMLFHSLYQPGSGMYLDQVVCRLVAGDSAPEAGAGGDRDGLLGRLFRQTFQRVVDLHPALRSAMVWEIDDRPHQVVLRHAVVPFHEEDWRGLTTEEAEAQLEGFLGADRERGFDLSRPPLVRLALLRLAARRYCLVLTYHHILLDAWSVFLVLRQALDTYAALAAGLDPPAGDPPRPYRDFVAWLRLQDLAPCAAFWRRELAGFSRLTPLPVAAPDAAEAARQAAAGGPSHGRRSRRLGDAATLALRRAARQHRLTLHTLLAAAWAMLLARLAGDEDVLFGIAVAGRPPALPGVEGMVGLFINTLPLRVRVAAAADLGTWLADLQRRQFDLLELQHSPLTAVQGWSEMPRGTAMFESLLVFENVPVGGGLRRHLGSDVALDGVDYRPRTNYPLTLLAAAEDGVAMELLFERGCCAAAAAPRLLEQLATLLAGIAAAAGEQPGATLGDLPLLSAAERQQLAVEWNDTRRPGAVPLAVHQMILAQAERAPGAPAVADLDSQGTARAGLTYEALGRRVRRLAGALRRRGAGPETVVACCVERSADLPVALLAILEAGAAYLPLDPDYPRERLDQILADSGAALLLTDEVSRDRLPQRRPPEILLGPAAAGDAAPEAPGQAARAAGAPCTPGDLAYVLYTSGSTGRPKGVEVSHGALSNFLADMLRRLGLGRGDTLLAVTSVGFDIAALELFLPLAAGARLVVAGAGATGSAEILAAAIGASGATCMQATPVSWRLLCEAGWAPPPHLGILCGGEALARPLAARLTAGGGRVWNLYGPTETTIWSAVEPVRAEEPGPVPIGRPLADTGLHVLDAHLRPLPIGAAGELYISGGGLARGYRGSPRQTAERFVPAPSDGVPGARLYRTGDIARHLADGRLEFLGRGDQQIKLRGHRIELGEIEAQLAEHPEVEVAVVQVEPPTPPRPGESAATPATPATDPQLTAYVVRAPAPPLAEEAIDELRRDRVAHWRRVWSATYGQPWEGDARLNLAGWRSSYSSRPLPEEEMREWVEQTVSRLLALAPRRVLEIGCGTGLLLLRLAGHCDDYCATDFSAEALAHVARCAAGAGGAPPRLLERSADDFSGLPPASFDVVIVNSVAQYFPDAGYLLRVVAGALEAVAPGGCVFLGDLRPLPLLEELHATVELQRAPPELPAAELRRRLHRAVAGERELLVDPGLFPALAGRWPLIGGWEVRLRQGRCRNELTNFRYDAILWRRAAEPVDGPPAGGEVAALDWEEEGLSPAAFERLLATAAAPRLRIGRIPNARLAGAVGARRLIAESPDGTPARDLRRAVAALGGLGVDPQDLWDAAARTPYEVEVGWDGAGAGGRCAVLCTRRGLGPARCRQEAVHSAPGAVAGERPRSWSSYVTPPPRRPDEQLAAALREHLAARLPAAMVPARFAFLAALPLTPNRKVDRGALRGLAAAPAASAAGRVAPRTPSEEIVAGIWSDLLGVARIGVHDNFFALGGHSLVAVQVRSRLRETLGVELSLPQVFEAATVEQLAERLELARDGRDHLQAPPLAAADRAGGAPLSFAQERLWVLHQQDPASAAYHIHFGVEILGPLRPAVLASSLTALAERHEALRTAFVAARGEPCQVIVAAPPEFHLPVVDLGALGARGVAVAAVAARRLGAQQRRTPFDLARLPLWRGALLRLAPAKHVLVLTLHHITCDGWSMTVLVREVLAFYEAFLHGLPPELPPLTVQYADYAVWQRGWLSGEVIERETAFWRRQLAGAPPLLDLPADRSRPARQGERGGVCRRLLPAALVGDLGTLCRRRGATLFMALLTAFYAVLHWLTGRVDLVVGTDSANRNRRETEGLIGFFVNQIVLRADLAGDPSLGDLLARTRVLTLDAFAHDELPFDRLVAALRPRRSLASAPLFQVKLVLQSFSPREIAGGTLALRSLPAEEVAAQLDLLLDVVPDGDALSVNAEYSRDLFDAPTIERWLAALEEALRWLAGRPEARLGELGAALSLAEHGRRRARQDELEHASLQSLQARRRRVGVPVLDRP